MTVSKDSQEKENSPPNVADEALASELLKDLDLKADPVADFAGSSPALRAVAAAQAKRNGKQTRPSEKRSAKDERLIYKLKKLDDGLAEPRPYIRNSIAPRQLHENYETEAEYQRRYKREYARLMRGVTAEDIKANQTIRELTTPEETKRKRATGEKKRREGIPVEDQSAARAARRKRAKQRQADATELDAIARKIF